ncbi:hypothetical protein HI914_07189 [Erysiphe necator]|nr:hypothetical protein HI914_07189 [Erysiphe necator]
MSALSRCPPGKTNSLPPPESSIKGLKRSAPALLPAFEPFSSSPGYPRPSKRQAFAPSSSNENRNTTYPTPIPSSTTGILSSSPPPIPSTQNEVQHLSINKSNQLSLSVVPSVLVPENGNVIRIGRSSKSSDFQLSSSRLISRVHVEARYIAATAPLEPNTIEIKCKGWNGLKVHCPGKTWQLSKNDTFTTETEFVEVMIEVQDTRVLLAWPGRDQFNLIDSHNNFFDNDKTPSRCRNSHTAHSNIPPSSPILYNERIEYPISPSPIRHHTICQFLDKLDAIETAEAQVYEDLAATSEEFLVNDLFALENRSSSFHISEPNANSELSDKVSYISDDENVPLKHSLDHSSSKFDSQIISIITQDPIVSTSECLSPTLSIRTATSDFTNQSEISNHSINQLAYSLKSSLPLSQIFFKLPSHLKESYATHQDILDDKPFTKIDLQHILNLTKCIGEISREGKDAAGKPLESEYYYILEQDHDEARRAAVQSLRKPSLRSCRKKHKQYYWRKPKTP